VSSRQQREHAADVVRAAIRGDEGELGRDLDAINQAAAEQGRRDRADAHRAHELAEAADRDAWALSWVLAEIMDGLAGSEAQRVVDGIVDDLPRDVRRRVIAVRHSRGPHSPFAPRDQFGRLPVPPPRAAVMRERVRTIDVELPDRPEDEIARIVPG
jgi:hypothetical protein